MFDVKLREIESRVSPAESTDVELSHAGDIEIDIIAFISYSIYVLKIDAMKRGWIFENGIAPRQRVGAFREMYIGRRIEGIDRRHTGHQGCAL